MPQIIKKCGKFKLNFSMCQKGRENSNSPNPLALWSLHCSGTPQDYLWIMIFKSRIGIRKKKGQQIYPPKNVFIPYFFPLIYIFFIFFFPALMLPGSWVGLWRSRRKRHQWRNTWDDAPLKIWWWEIGSCIGMECSGRNSNFLFTNSKPIKLNDHCNFMIGKIAVRPFSTAQVQEMDSEIKYTRIPI